jgi:hypothetical protein
MICFPYQWQLASASPFCDAFETSPTVRIVGHAAKWLQQVEGREQLNAEVILSAWLITSMFAKLSSRLATGATGLLDTMKHVIARISPDYSRCASSSGKPSRAKATGLWLERA